MKNPRTCVTVNGLLYAGWPFLARGILATPFPPSEAVSGETAVLVPGWREVLLRPSSVPSVVFSELSFCLCLKRNRIRCAMNFSAGDIPSGVGGVDRIERESP